MANIKVTPTKENFIWAQYKLKVNRLDYRKRRVALYNDIAVMAGVGWQAVYRAIKRRLDKSQLKIIFND